MRYPTTPPTTSYLLASRTLEKLWGLQERSKSVGRIALWSWCCGCKRKAHCSRSYRVFSTRVVALSPVLVAPLLTRTRASTPSARSATTCFNDHHARLRWKERTRARRDWYALVVKGCGGGDPILPWEVFPAEADSRCCSPHQRSRGPSPGVSGTKG